MKDKKNKLNKQINPGIELEKDTDIELLDEKRIASAPLNNDTIEMVVLPRFQTEEVRDENDAASHGSTVEENEICESETTSKFDGRSYVDTDYETDNDEKVEESEEEEDNEKESEEEKDNEEESYDGSKYEPTTDDENNKRDEDATESDENDEELRF